MTSTLKPYPAYKDSGVPWLGDVPEHWGVRRLKYLLRERNERSADGTEQLLRVSQYTGVTKRRSVGGGATQDSPAESLVGYKLVSPDDLVVNIMLAWNGSMGVSPFPGMTSPAYCVYKFETTAHPWYFHYLLRSPSYKSGIKAESTGVVESRLRLYTDDLFRLEALVPPLPEQTAIVRFLDHADCRIRRYIAAKRKLIALLNEQKQSIIHHAVTRGLDPTVRLKPSGVDWLGDVPEHWEIASLRLRYSVELGKMLDAKRITGAHLVPYLRNTDVQWGAINTSCLPQMDIASHEYSRYTVQPGDLLVCEGGEVGRAAIWPGHGDTIGYQKALHRLRPLRTNRDDPHFLYLVLYDTAKRGVFKADGSENTIAHLTGGKLRRCRVAFPPPVEQHEIVAQIETATSAIEQSVASVQREIGLVTEYRTRLITDVVTGKLDVREVAEGLPQFRRSDVRTDDCEPRADHVSLGSDPEEPEAIDAKE